MQFFFSQSVSASLENLSPSVPEPHTNPCVGGTSHTLAKCWVELAPSMSDGGRDAWDPKTRCLSVEAPSRLLLPPWHSLGFTSAAPHRLPQSQPRAVAVLGMLREMLLSQLFSRAVAPRRRASNFALAPRSAHAAKLPPASLLAPVAGGFSGG